LKPELGGRNFECPEGIEFVEVDPDTGSLATLSCPRRELIAVTEKLAPNVECLLHADLPDSIGVEADQVAERVDVNETILTQHSRSPGHAYGKFNPSVRTLTRVDVDKQGKRTLVNSMR
jgi:hypothetical protein